MYFFSHFFAVPFEILLLSSSVRLYSYTKDRLFHCSGLPTSLADGALMRSNFELRKKRGPWLPTLRPFGWLLLSIKDKNRGRSTSLLLLLFPLWSFGEERISTMLLFFRLIHQAKMFVSIIGGTISQVCSGKTWSFLILIVGDLACWRLISRKRWILRPLTFRMLLMQEKQKI